MDRNAFLLFSSYNDKQSLSARRAWIEIAVTSEVSDSVPLGRSPQGERG